jgi:phage protein D/phage baseplate assembly protein gpV
VSATSERHVALYTVLVDGSEINEQLMKRVREVRIASYLRLPDVCTLSASFPKGQPGQDEPIDGHPFEIGKQLEIRLGARESLTTSTLFRGDILTLEPKFGAGSVELLVRGFDHSHVLQRSRRSVAYTNMTASDIVQKIASTAGFEANCDPSGDPFDHVYQHNETDWDFIWRLAERIGFEFYVVDKTANFRAPVTDPPVELDWPATLHSFSPRVTAVQQVAEVRLLAWNPKTKEEILATASEPKQIAKIGIERDTIKQAFDGDSNQISTEPVFSQAEGQKLAQALLDKLANGYIAADGVCDGNPSIRAGTTIHVTGVGQSFSGTYRVATATHLLRGGGTYETHFSNSPAHTLLGSLSANQGRAQPDVAGQIVVGVVTNNDDPDGMGRVRVRYPTLSSDSEGTWARIATPSAGNGRGLLMMPVVGEEVLVAFEHDDMTRPYVLGSLFNGTDKPGDDLLQGKDGSFALESDKNIFMQSKQNYTVRSDGKLRVEVGDNVEEKYKKDWTNEITGKASLKATQPFEIDGQDVVIKGQAQINVEGNATVTIKCGAAQIQLSSAGVQISGPMIQLG